MKLKHLLAPAAFAALASLIAFAADEKPRGGGEGKRGGQRPQDAPTDDVRFLFRTDVPAHPLDVVLGRPTKDSVTVSVLAYEEREGVIAFGEKSGELAEKTSVFPLKKDEPVEVPLKGLRANSQVFYQLSTRAPGGEWKLQPERSFRTQRVPGSAFTFTVQADPHLDFGVDTAVYEKSLANALAAKTDFHIDLGDTFMVDKRPTYTLAAPQYVAQRYYFGLVGHSAPVFLVLGNHDGESMGGGRKEGGDGMAVWSNGMRKKYFPNPSPDGFYTGNATPHTKAGLLENYYAWEWGDALFIALDQFWYSQRIRKDGGDNWGRTLGREQYEWLRKTLETSKAKYTFVFTHHLVGGATPEGRGGVEASHFFEWGGKELDGTSTFTEKRPGWAAPIHDLLAKRGSCVVFHGHDHIFVRGERDGVVYQLVPQPGHSRNDNTRNADEYGYKSGVKFGASGIMRVSVSPEKAVVDYVRAYPAAAESAERKSGSVTYSYEVRPK